MLGVYVHIPFCLQRCRYCDFATYSSDQIQVNSEYVDVLVEEIRKQKNIFTPQKIETVYFGGGTPSLLPPKDIIRILDALKSEGFIWDSKTEVTLEMNPATLNRDHLVELIAGGVNRISVGAQTFSDSHLKNCGRKHSAAETLKTVELLKTLSVDFSMDLLFALPEQTMEELSKDLEIFMDVQPAHISPYCLTLPERHPMNVNRPSEGRQTEMFERLWQVLESNGYERYEISNFSKPCKKSRHNSLYWSDDNYWGLGLSAHSYKKAPDWGERFWNPSDYNTYIRTVNDRPWDKSNVADFFAPRQRESLEFHQSLTDYCHTFLRTRSGISENSLRQKFGEPALKAVRSRLEGLQSSGLLQQEEQSWSLSSQGVLLSNLAFEALLFVAEDVDNPL